MSKWKEWLILGGVIVGLTLATDFIKDLIVARIPVKTFIPKKDSLIPLKYAEIIDLIQSKIEPKYQIPEDIVFSWINQMSPGWQPRTGPNGEKWLTQIPPQSMQTYMRMYLDNPKTFNFDDQQMGLEMGLKHLSTLYKVTNDWFLALCAYRSGLPVVLSGSIPSDTIKYAMEIIHLWELRS